ncbi:MAG TPA: hypothetical protein VFW66_12490 [Gemmatimonadales bacterium]|nr:hypothetical protein [Gemmatimonadales bacterium]
MQKETPDHHDADIVLRLYELRREPVMRDSRSRINADLWPATATELMAVTQRGHPLNAAFRQTSGYWEMAYGMARHGIVHGEYLMENNGEGIFLFARVEPYLTELRAAVAPPSQFRNAEWVTQHTARGRELLEFFRNRVRQRLGARAGA